MPLTENQIQQLRSKSRLGTLATFLGNPLPIAIAEAQAHNASKNMGLARLADAAKNKDLTALKDALKEARRGTLMSKLRAANMARLSGRGISSPGAAVALAGLAAGRTLSRSVRYGLSGVATVPTPLLAFLGHQLGTAGATLVTGGKGVGLQSARTKADRLFNAVLEREAANTIKSTKFGPKAHLKHLATTAGRTKDMISALASKKLREVAAKLKGSKAGFAAAGLGGALGGYLATRRSNEEKETDSIDGQ